MYHFALGLGVIEKRSWNGYIDNWIKQEDMVMGGFFTNVLDFWKHRHDSNFLFMKYEDMKKDPKESIIKFADHLERTLTDEELDQVVHHSEVKNMKKSYENFEKRVQGGVFITKAMGKVPLIRKGQIGDWKNHLLLLKMSSLML
ncbi:sulfotransferase 1B1-like [Antedon mediterranea]|uniref:sulfotransferase 1B1-like n=1 Tax=Antedon mediterranea TaxID=105859 RepID=UPI003AF8AEA7